MSCITEIVKSLRENRLQETTFVYNGSEYSNKYGNYSKNRRPISREDYHKARRGLLSQEYDKTSLDYSLHIPHKLLAKKIGDLQDFIDGLDYDKEYEVLKDTRGHLERLDTRDEESRVSQIMEDTGVSEKEAIAINKVILEYTSTNNYTVFTDDEKKHLDKFIDESPVYSPPPVYRGVGFKESLVNNSTLNYYEEFASLEEGSVISFRNYASFSSNPDVAIEFAHSNGDHQVYIINTKNLTGVSIDHLSSINYQEDELIYKADTKMIVQNKLVDGDIVYLHVEEVGLEEDIYDDDILDIDIDCRMTIE